MIKRYQQTGNNVVDRALSEIQNQIDKLKSTSSTGLRTKVPHNIDSMLKLGTVEEAKSPSNRHAISKKILSLNEQGIVQYLKFGIANTNPVQVDHASVVDNDYAKFTANGLEGRSASEVRSDIGAGTSSVANLNDLGDVAFSSGDLTISALDTIKAVELTSGSVDGSGLQIEAQNGVGTNSAGGDLTLESGRQTGNHATSSIIFNTGVLSGSTGTTVRNSAQVAKLTQSGLSVSNSDGATAGVITLNINGDATNYLHISSEGLQSSGNLTLDGGGGSIFLDDDGHTFATFAKSDSYFILN